MTTDKALGKYGPEPFRPQAEANDYNAFVKWQYFVNLGEMSCSTLEIELGCVQIAFNNSIFSRVDQTNTDA